MPEPPPDFDRPDPGLPAAPRRAVADWEYSTAYIQQFQVRLAPGLLRRLSEWAEQDRVSVMDLLIGILEGAASRRGTGGGAV